MFKLNTELFAVVVVVVFIVMVIFYFKFIYFFLIFKRELSSSFIFSLYSYIVVIITAKMIYSIRFCICSLSQLNAFGLCVTKWAALEENETRQIIIRTRLIINLALYLK